ncbi:MULTISPECIES: alpha/beta fold hydrolase [Agromyces]|uniref:Alpha/beta fold hydrolase n=2 Tax=Agromyces TaxID=33877 RepID=A0A6L5R405_9MICO|nr:MULTISPECIES: alpha/beta hydrolase [Agromyces]MRX44719.1 alpha/beta fold hydrolase [Agromyces kandeliae]RXZ50161.1 alpha/beta hydrolase [Agromyces binzhouensis]
MHATNQKSRRGPIRVAIAVAAVAAATAISVAIPAAADVARAPSEPKPTIVLVHGAFADSSGWNDVTERLQKRGYTVLAASNPLRGLMADAAYVRSILESIEGPIVLVGHSYGGAVITNAATGLEHVEALVYVAAYALDEGERLVDANALGGGHTDLADHIVIRPYPGAPEGDADGYIDPAYFHELFAADLPRKQTAVMAASQRPAALQALFTPSGEPAWESIPSWYVVASQDHTIPPEAERVMAERAGATTIELDSSHVAMMSHPGAVADVILDAAG